VESFKRRGIGIMDGKHGNGWNSDFQLTIDQLLDLGSHVKNYRKQRTIFKREGERMMNIVQYVGTLENLEISLG
jgi:hypothetical protein